MSMLRDFTMRTMFSPRWAPLRRLLEPYLLSAPPEKQWLRIVMNKETRRLVDGISPSTLDALEISGTNWAIPGYFKSYRTVEYPTFDICVHRLEERFDLIIADQVFEHLLWPYRAVRNVHEMLSIGGRFLVTTPFLLKVHGHPIDCSRWTELGLKHLLAEGGFDLHSIVTGCWGNKSCVRSNLNGWRYYQPWRHSLKNESDYPIVVWAMARKTSY